MTSANQRELFADQGLPDGFRYAENALTGVQERTLAENFAALPFKPFEFHGYLGKRRISCAEQHGGSGITAFRAWMGSVIR